MGRIDTTIFYYPSLSLPYIRRYIRTFFYAHIHVNPDFFRKDCLLTVRGVSSCTPRTIYSATHPAACKVLDTFAVRKARHLAAMTKMFNFAVAKEITWRQ